jgi:hypothetical protein
MKMTIIFKIVVTCKFDGVSSEILLENGHINCLFDFSGAILHATESNNCLKLDCYIGDKVKYQKILTLFLFHLL